MKVVVTHLNNDSVENFYGEPEQITHQLVARFPFVYRDPRTTFYDPTNLNDVVGRLNRSQNISVRIEV
jgi:hypothetical protein